MKWARAARPSAWLEAAIVACGGLAGLGLVAGACSDGESVEPPSPSGYGGAGATGAGNGTAHGGAAGHGGNTAVGGQGIGGEGGSAPCSWLEGSEEIEIGVAASAGEHALGLTATTASRTSWAEPGNEALVLEVRVAGSLRGHLVLHQGADGGRYGMHLGPLEAGERVTAAISALSAAAAEPSVCIGAVELSLPADAEQAESLANAPIVQWPTEKRFDDLPVVLGWSKSRAEYQLVASNENGGTVEICGGGAEGIQAEIARWGRAVDIERVYRYGAEAEWARCTGTTSVASHPLRMEAGHPILYYGDGHNRLFESRGGYGQACGTGSAEQADGDLVGWNVDNPGNDAALDAPYVVTLRPLPVALDAIGYAEHTGRREALVDRYAPWLYRILDLELRREGKIDQEHTFGMQQYLYVDVLVADVDGSGDGYCSLWGVSGGFKLRARVAGHTVDGPQMTADYVSGPVNVKRVAIPLGEVVAHEDVTGIVFDAYDDDGIYWLGLGDVLIPRPSGDNGSTVDVIHPADTAINVYVDDDSSGCSGGVNSDGPDGPAPCVGSDYALDW